MSKRALSLFVFALSFVLVRTAVAQPADVFATVPHERSLIDQKLQQHTRRSSSGAIPASTYYGLVFRELLLKPAANPGIPESDWSLLRALPSHHDARFVSADLARLEPLCQSLDKTDDSALASLAARYDSERRQSESRLDVHYAEVLAKLTPATRTLVEGRRAALAASQQVSQVNLNMEGFARDVPAAARALLQRGCQTHAARKDQGPPPSHRLIDDTPQIIPLTR